MYIYMCIRERGRERGLSHKLASLSKAILVGAKDDLNLSLM